MISKITNFKSFRLLQDRWMGAILLIISLSARANLHVGTKYLKLDQKPVDFIELWNSSEQMMYIQVDAFKYMVDDEGKVTEYRNRNPKKLGLLYTPNKIVIKPGKKKRLRVTAFNKNLGNQHEYYKLTYNILNKPHEELAKDDAAVSASVRIGILYETLIDVGRAPLNYSTKIKVKDDGESIKITNTGNALMSIGPFYQCKDLNQCKQQFLYSSLIPGQSFKYKLKKDQAKNIVKVDIGNYFGRKQRQSTVKLK